MGAIVVMDASLVLFLLSALKARRFFNCHNRNRGAKNRIDPDQKMKLFFCDKVIMQCGTVSEQQ